MTDEHSNDPLHGITLEMMLRKLVNKYGWDGLSKRIRLNCLKNDPSIPSVLNFLRKTPWARPRSRSCTVTRGSGRETRPRVYADNW